MKNLFSFVALGCLATASLTAQAQFTLDGRATAAEIGAGVGKYQLAGTYTGNHLDTDRGLKALYVGYTATTLNIMVVASAEAPDVATTFGYRALVLYLNTPARTGAPAGLPLLGSADGQSPLRHIPTLDMQTDYGFRASVGPATAAATDVYFSAVSYVTGTAVAAGTDPYVGQGSKTGAVVTSATTVLPGTRFSYFNTANLTANTTNAGLEIEIPLSALGTTTLTAGSRLDLMAAYTNSNGDFFSDVIPQIAGRTTALGVDPDFSTIAGTQAVAFVLGSGVLATRAETAAALDFNVYPNPAPGAATIAYRVPAGAQPVTLAVYNSLGQQVRSVAEQMQAGSQQVPLGNLTAGAYLVKLRVGDQLTSRKVVVE
ncbi:T9SS type A sorting domain-containing protein [Hymenobacter canadensis]|uniref:T9SS type A sorting domain-containing protein n=1 Tax=Hymenobacter canadensis TaxID=2999067 RepID=A0ABY7LQN9_9BACT|nr:T9SS type A sorting domain-containing protein [Hymenobacter canadensis]WBA42221.1 T9SS type A sorting domain-containing protein [Hymenobacter canadensis]